MKSSRKHASSLAEYLVIIQTESPVAGADSVCTAEVNLQVKRQALPGIICKYTIIINVDSYDMIVEGFLEAEVHVRVPPQYLIK